MMDGMDPSTVEELSNRIDELAIRFRSKSEYVEKRALLVSRFSATPPLLARLSRSDELSRDLLRSLNKLARQLRRQAAEQRRVSRATTGELSRGPSRPSPGAGGTRPTVIGPQRPILPVKPGDVSVDPPTRQVPGEPPSRSEDSEKAQTLPGDLQGLRDSVFELLPRWMLPWIPSGWIPGPPYSYFAFSRSSNTPAAIGWGGLGLFWLVSPDDPSFASTARTILALWGSTIPFAFLAHMGGLLVVPWNLGDAVSPNGTADTLRAGGLVPTDRPAAESADVAPGTGAPGSTVRSVAVTEGIGGGSTAEAPRSPAPTLDKQGPAVAAPLANAQPSEPMPSSGIARGSEQGSWAGASSEAEGTGSSPATTPEPETAPGVMMTDASGDAVPASDRSTLRGPSRFALSGEAPAEANNGVSDQASSQDGPPWALLGLVAAGLAVAGGGLGMEVKRDKGVKGRLKSQFEQPLAARASRGEGPAQQLGSQGLQEKSLLLGLPNSPRPQTSTRVGSSLMDPMQGSLAGWA